MVYYSEFWIRNSIASIAESFSDEYHVHKRTSNRFWGDWWYSWCDTNYPLLYVPFFTYAICYQKHMFDKATYNQLCLNWWLCGSHINTRPLPRDAYMTTSTRIYHILWEWFWQQRSNSDIDNVGNNVKGGSPPKSLSIWFIYVYVYFSRFIL